MVKNILILGAMALVVSIGYTSVGIAAEFKIKKHSVVFNGNKYFRDNAYAIDIASYGVKHDPIGSKARLEETNKIRREHLIGNVDVNGPFDVDWVSTSSVDLGSVIRFGSNGGKVSVGRNEAKAANLKLISLEIPEGKLKRILNTSAGGALKALRDEGKDGRVVSEVWIVVEGALAEKVEHGAELIAQSGSDLKVTFKMAGTNTTVITFGEGDVFAYRMHKVKKWSKGKEKIEELESDYKGAS